MDEDRFNIEIRKFLKEVGVTSEREIERIVREGQVKGGTLKLRMTLTVENTPLSTSSSAQSKSRTRLK